MDTVSGNDADKSAELYGWLAAFASCLAFGSFGATIKSKECKSVNVDPLVFQSYKTLMVFCTSWLVLLTGRVPFSFTPWGILSAAFWVPGGVATVYAVKFSGLAIGIGAGSCFIVLTSFIWGVFIFGEPVKNRLAASMAIVLLMAGLFGMAYFSSPESVAALPTSPLVDNTTIDNRNYSDYTSDEGTAADGIERSLDLPNRKSDAFECLVTIPKEGSTLLKASNNEITLATKSNSILTSTTVSTESMDFARNAGDIMDGFIDEEDESTVRDSAIDDCGHDLLEEDEDVFGVKISKRKLGILLAALVTGVWGGSILVPMKWCNSEIEGAGFVISFGIGSSVITLLLWICRLLYNVVINKASIVSAYQMLPSFHWKILWRPGCLGGFLWSLGNFFSLLSVKYLGEGVGYPAVQTSILVAGLWGIFFFKEITGLRRISLWLCSATLALGGILLLSYEHGSG